MSSRAIETVSAGKSEASDRVIPLLQITLEADRTCDTEGGIDLKANYATQSFHKLIIGKTMARIFEPTVRSLGTSVVPVSLDSREASSVRPHLVGAAVRQDNLLDDDIVPDSRIYTRPAAIVEAKLTSRINASRRHVGD